MEEIDLSLTPDDSMPPGIDNDNYDPEGDILFLEEFLSNDFLSLPKNESFHFDIPSSPRPPAKPLDNGIYFDDEPITIARILNTHARGFVLRSLDPLILNFNLGIQYPNLIVERLSLSTINKRL
nr:hypothetical protein [Tanacetum cinerariifolium]